MRIFLSSPGDVVEERAIAREVLEHLPKDPLLKGQLTIEVVSWDDPVAPVPMLATLTPRQAIERGLPSPSECDLTVVILWGRMGTLLSEPPKADGSQYLSGTEYEFENACAADRPVLVYKRTGPIPVTLDDPDLDEKRRQKTLVERFFERFTNVDGSLGSGHHAYEDSNTFRRQFEAHAKAFVRQLLETSNAKLADTRPASAGSPPAASVPDSYRQWLQTRCGGVELLGLRLKQGQAVRLGSVYVPLSTTRPVDTTERERRVQRQTFGEQKPSDQVLLARIAESSAYVSGDPGSGKSTFCRWLAWLVCEGMAPLAEVETPHQYREHLDERLIHRLPLLVPLREFWRWIPETARSTRRDVESAVGSWLKEKGAPGIDGALVSAHADQGTALFIFDGIDEVPPPRRAALLEALGDACDEWTRRGNRLVVTGRPYGLSESDIRRLGLPHAPIRPLARALQWLLIRRWFRILTDGTQAPDVTARKMAHQVREQTWLSPLTQNPLLLTGMCIVFGDGKGLPEDKYELYDRVSDAVLHNRIPDRQRLQLVRGRLAVVAHGMHTGEGLSESRHTPQAEVTNNEIDRILRWYQDRSIWTESHVQATSDARDELLTQTGLLLPRGEHQAAFLHLSFQEFLAAQRLADIDIDRIRALFLERSSTPEWRNTLSFLYGGLLYLSTTPERAVRLLTDLVGRLPADNAGLTLAVADAAEILMRRGLRLSPAVEDRLRQSCFAVMRGRAAARDRTLAGTALGRIGDPRFVERQWYLPDEPLLGFVEIEAGSFSMGSDLRKDDGAYVNERPQHDVTLPTYFIGRWPVTIAQFKSFVDDPDNGGFIPRDLHCVNGIANHPVAYVSWHEASAYCQWLTLKLRTADDTPEPVRSLLRGTLGTRWHVTMPSEAEWEKAARGADGRSYPWGGTADANRVNCRETGIAGPTPVGCFPDGGSPYGIEDLTGNVWEWTRDSWQRTHSAQSRAHRETGLDDSSAAVRGASFGDRAKDARAACRAEAVKKYRWAMIGFRLVISPSASEP